MSNGGVLEGQDGLVAVERIDDGSGVTVIDRIERRQYSLTTPSQVSLAPADPGEFLYPVDTAVRTGAGAFELPNVITVCVRDANGEMLAQADHFDHETFARDEYSIELHGPVKIFLEADAGIEIHSAGERMTIRFEGEPEVRIGARSYHDRPAGTVETTGDPASLMRAVSTFGSALKTLSPERSFPTLRGHPPAVELGDSLRIPPGLEPPDTGIRIEVPREHGAVYTVAPLAYYLGARVVPGETPRLVTDTGFEHRLDAGGDFETETEQVLKRAFFLDCVTRTEGYLEIDLQEREAIEDAVDLDFAGLYGAPIAERTERYLAVPFEAIADHLPRWRLTNHVDPDPRSVESLPFLLGDLPSIRTTGHETVDPSAVAPNEAATSAIESFTRGDGAVDRSLYRPGAADSTEQVWIGEGIPLNSVKATPEAFRNRLDREPTDDDIEVTVVYNDERMRAERSEDGYGTNEALPFDVRVASGLTCEELRSILAEGSDFLHYIGHVDDDGFRCVDGRLDATGLEDAEVGVDAFLLNACHSYDQGMGLIEAGAIGGIVTLDEVVNSGAVRVGRTLASLVDAGFTLGTALDVVRETETLGKQYVVVGDSRLAISQFPGGTPHVCSVDRANGSVELSIRMYHSPTRKFGSVFTPHLREHERFHLHGGEIGPLEVSREELDRFLSLENVPVILDGDLRWSESVDVDAI